MNTFAFKAAEEVLSNSVVTGIAFAGHTLGGAEINEMLTVGAGSILDAAVRVENQVMLRSVVVYSQVESGKGKNGENSCGAAIRSTRYG